VQNKVAYYKTQCLSEKKPKDVIYRNNACAAKRLHSIKSSSNVYWNSTTIIIITLFSRIMPAPTQRTFTDCCSNFTG